MLSGSVLKAQQLSKEELDSLYVIFIQSAKPEILPLNLQPVQLSPAENKCRFILISQVKHNLYNFTTEQQNILKPLLDRPVLDTSIVSPSGFFRIHYNVTGSIAPKYDPLLSVEENVNQVALAIDSAYNFEVNYLGYPPPPSDNNTGGDILYDIYITSALGAYGFTTPEESIGNQKYTSYIEIHYSFAGSGFATHGFDAMRVTSAHEFHHSIQIGNYTGDKYSEELDAFFYEMTSTSMEEFVYDNVNDYYAYMPHYFNNPGKAFGYFSHNTVDGYDIAIWNIFMKDKFGYDIIKRQWELLPQMRALEAIALSLNEKGTFFGRMLNEFGIWTYFTNYRTIAGEYFEEASEYPPVKSVSTVQFNSQPVNGLAKPTSNNIITFYNSSDTLVAIISNTDYVSGINNINGSFNYEYILSADSIEGSTKLTDNYFAKLNVTNSLFWAVSEILNYQVVRQDSTVYQVDFSNDLYAYPNPFYYSKRYSNYCDCIEILIDPANSSQADLNIYTSGMQLIYSSTLPVENNSFGRKILRWNIRGISEKLASGVYIYAVKNGDEILKGKIVIFNE